MVFLSLWFDLWGCYSSLFVVIREKEGRKRGEGCHEFVPRHISWLLFADLSNESHRDTTASPSGLGLFTSGLCSSSSNLGRNGAGSRLGLFITGFFSSSSSFGIVKSIVSSNGSFFTLSMQGFSSVGGRSRVTLLDGYRAGGSLSWVCQ